MNAHFNGERLKKARIYRGMTVAELAEKVDCQRQTLSMYEIAKSQPADRKTVEKIAHVLDFPTAFFYEYTKPCVSGTVYFRSLLTTNKKYRNEQVIKMDFLSQVYALLQDYVEFPQFEPLNLPQNTSPEDAAVALRNAWRLGTGPIDNLISVVEQHGILVTSFSTSTNDVDAFSEYVETDGSSTFLIAYSNNKTSASRIHFDVAHELGHICLHDWGEDIEELSKEEFKLRERQANEFAAAFLLPKEAFFQDASSGPATIQHYKKLKSKWKVSIAAMIRRAKNLEVITSDEYQMMIRIMQRRGQRKEEPLDDVLMTASPGLLKTAVIMLLQEDVFTKKDFMEELSVSYGLSIRAEEVEYLLDLPSGTLALPRILDFTSLQLRKKADY